jgi:hypothetical protein
MISCYLSTYPDVATAREAKKELVLFSRNQPTPLSDCLLVMLKPGLRPHQRIYDRDAATCEFVGPRSNFVARSEETCKFQARIPLH